MATASTPTLLPLDRFAELVGINPLHFNQIAPPAELELTTCGMPLLQYSWQSADAISREEIAMAIADAEWELERWLNYAPLPRWYDEHVMLPIRNETVMSARVQPARRHFISGGIRAKTLIQAASPVAYSDADGDGFSETVTITATLPAGLTDADEIAVFYPVTLVPAADDAWQIRPISVSLSGVTATITAKRWQFVVPTKLSPLAPAAVVASDAASFLSTVDVYRVHNDPSHQVEFHIRNSCGNCDGGVCNACGYEIAEGCISAIDYRMARLDLTHAAWNASTSKFDIGCCIDGAPERTRLYYRAGLKGPGGSTIKMSLDLELAIARLAMTKLDRAICGCQSIQQSIDHWTADLGARVSAPSKSMSTTIPAALRNCPWGYKRGALYAYSVVLTERLP